MEVLSDYQNLALKTTDIAAKHCINMSKITLWAKEAGLTLRHRGRWFQPVPTARQAEIMKLATVLTYQQIADRLGMHKQSVHRIVKRWRERQPSAYAKSDLTPQPLNQTGMKKRTTNTTKTKTPRSKQPIRTEVVSFRISYEEYQMLTTISNQKAAEGVNSPQQMARKIVCNYLAGQLNYGDTADKKFVLNMVGA